MSKQREIVLAGVGGQGMILCGTMMAKAAVLYDNKKATLASEYGTETRGTFAKSDVIISDEEIYFPNVTHPDVIICLHPVAYARYAGKATGSTILLYDSSMVTPEKKYANEMGYPITEAARQLGNPAMANILTMGIVAGMLGGISPEGAKKIVGDFFSKKGEKIVEANCRAFDCGYEVGQNAKDK